MQEGECQEKAVPCCRFHGSEEVEIVKPRPHRGHRLPPTRRNPATNDGLQAEARFILREDFHGEAIAMPRERLGELGGQGGGEVRHGLRTFFLWDGRGRFGLARSSPRTNA